MSPTPGSVRPLRDALTLTRDVVFGPTPWLTVTPASLSGFVEATNPEEGRGDLTISGNNQLGESLVDGLLLLSMVPHFFWQLWHYRDEGTWALNYGYDRVRFVTPVYLGDQIRLSFRVVEATRRGEAGVLVKASNLLEVAGRHRPAMTAESLMLFLERGDD